MTHEKHDWAAERVNAATYKVCREYPYYPYPNLLDGIRQALALELRKVAAECVAIVEEGNLLTAPRRIRAAFPDREGV